MRISLPNLAKEADRYGTSDGAAASLATAALIDIGIVTKEDQSLVIDKSKLRRERMKLKETMQNEFQESVEDITGIYFDGRRDKTMTKTKVEEKWRSEIAVDDHNVLVVEPGGEHFTHVTTASGKSSDIANSIFAVITDKSASETIIAVRRQYQYKHRL